MKPHDKRRLNAFIKDEEEAVEEYREIAVEMREGGFMEHSDLFFDMANDEARHAETVRQIKASHPRYE